ncbi:hypothetical protein [Streptosporangium roseum]|uniref:hypothetical protein n=1 Tax=Streptosporangium roseum TaxID=2001 RepID=UPI00146EDE8B|nr:hypothetical protein [Streptosporangium roseum]
MTTTMHIKRFRELEAVLLGRARHPAKQIIPFHSAWSMRLPAVGQAGCLHIRMDPI